VKEENFEEGVEGPVLSKGLGVSELSKKGGGLYEIAGGEEDIKRRRLAESGDFI
jgi:hypothetical protein